MMYNDTEDVDGVGGRFRANRGNQLPVADLKFDIEDDGRLLDESIETVLIISDLSGVTSVFSSNLDDVWAGSFLFSCELSLFIFVR